MKASVFSDMHLESSNYSLPSPDADILLACGDISTNLEQGFDWLYRQAQGRPVVFVPGNHEYEGKTMAKAKESMSVLALDYGIHYLDNNSITIDGISFLGSTLWSGFDLFPGFEDMSKDSAKFGVCDFSTIFVAGKCLTVDQMEQMYKESVAWLELALQEHKANTTVVLTHFAPFSKSLNPYFELDVMSAYWVNRLDDVLGGFADFWFHGHTHTSFKYDMHGTKVICNPRGSSSFSNLSSNPEFKECLVTLRA